MRPKDDRGASLVLIAITMTLLLGIAALAIDLGVLRSDIRSDRLVADAASTAGVAQINPFGVTNAVLACQTAWEYVLLNLEDEGTAPAAPDCATVFSGECAPATIRQATQVAGPYTITISHPIPDGHALMGAQAIDPQIDGSPCQRLAVTIQRLRPHTFARMIGSNSDTTTVDSVARVATAPGEGEIVPLLLLEPLACEALFTSGQGRVTVTYNDATDTPGIIVVDSNASNCGPSVPFSIDNVSVSQGWIRAIPVPGENIPSAILSYALSAIPPADPAASYDPGDLTNPVPAGDITDPNEPSISWFRLFPEPTPAFERITRAPIDWRYNCKSGYPDYPLVAPSGPGIPILDCPFTTPNYIDQHVSSYGTGVPVGFQSWMAAGHSCSPNGVTLALSGDWHIDCPPQGPNDIGLSMNGGSISIDGDVLLDGGIDLQSDAAMTINPSNSSDGWMFVREGIILKRAQSALTLNRTFVYLADGAVDLRAGAGGLVWTAPADPANPFDDLALWSEAHMVHEIGGQAGNTLTGTFFTPMAEPFGLTGQAGQFQLHAQFITRRLEVKGQGEVKMTPDPDKTTPIPARAVLLIR